MYERLYKSDYRHLLILDRMYLYIQQRLDIIDIRSSSFLRFRCAFKEKLQNFSNVLEDLGNKIRIAPSVDLLYYNVDISSYGLQCFKMLDEIGEFLDANIQTHQIEKNFKDLHDDMFIDEIYF